MRMKIQCLSFFIITCTWMAGAKAASFQEIGAGLFGNVIQYPEFEEVQEHWTAEHRSLEERHCNQAEIGATINANRLPEVVMRTWGPSGTSPDNSALYTVARHLCHMAHGIPSYLPEEYRLGSSGEMIEAVPGQEVSTGTYPEPDEDNYAESRMEEYHAGSAAIILGNEVDPGVSCAKCHAAQYQQWQGTAHATAMRGSYDAFRMTVAEAVCNPDATGQCQNEGAAPLKTTVFCNGCHSPGQQRAAGVVEAEEDKGEEFFNRRMGRELPEIPESNHPSYMHMSNFEMEGVSCFACHSQFKLDMKVKPEHGFVGMGDANRAFISMDFTNNRNGRWDTGGLSVLKMAGPARVGDRSPPHGASQWTFSMTDEELEATDVLTPEEKAGMLRQMYAWDEVNSRVDSSRMCIACHDVRLPNAPQTIHGQITAGDTGEQFRRLENLGTEYREYKEAGGPHTCVSCHMSTYGHNDTAQPGEFPVAPLTAVAGVEPRLFQVHGFPGVTSPQNTEGGRFGNIFNDGMDTLGLPMNRDNKKASLLRQAVSMSHLTCEQKLYRNIGQSSEDDAHEVAADDSHGEEAGSHGTAANGSTLRVVLDVLNDGTGHRVPSGFSQEREVWIKLEVTDLDSGEVVYRSGYTWEELKAQEPQRYQEALEYILASHNESNRSGLVVTSTEHLESLVSPLDLTNEFVALNHSADPVKVLTADVSEHGPDEDHRPDGQNLGIRKFTNKFQIAEDGKLVEVFSAHLGQIMENRHSIPFDQRVKVMYDIPVANADSGRFRIDYSMNYRAFPPHFAEAVHLRERARAQEQAAAREASGASLSTDGDYSVYPEADYLDSVETVVMAEGSFNIEAQAEERQGTRCEWVGKAERTYEGAPIETTPMGRSVALPMFAEYGISGQCAEQRYDDWVREFRTHKVELWTGNIRCTDESGQVTNQRKTCRALFEKHRPTAEECMLQSEIFQLTGN